MNKKTIEIRPAVAPVMLELPDWQNVKVTFCTDGYQSSRIPRGLGEISIRNVDTKESYIVPGEWYWDDAQKVARAYGNEPDHFNWDCAHG